MFTQHGVNGPADEDHRGNPMPRDRRVRLNRAYETVHHWFAQSQLGPVDNYVVR